MKKLLLLVAVFFVLASVLLVYHSVSVKKGNVLVDLNYAPANKVPQYPPVTLDSIFDNTKSSIHNSEKTITIIATGDVIPARSVNYQTVTRNNFIWPYQEVKQLFDNSDINFINLEAPFVNNCAVTQEGMTFCSDPRNLEGLRFINVKAANLANNHSTNYGQQEIINTVSLLKNEGITAVGVSGPQYINVKGSQIAFLGYNDIGVSTLVAQTNEDLIQNEVVDAKKKADIVIVAFHWGEEYTSQPTKRQVSLAHLAIDSGADLIIGNHPHWIQPVEIYKDKLIVYAHGNFVFDQMWSQKTKEGVVGIYLFYQNRLIDVEFVPIIIRDFGQAVLPNPEDSLRILNQMKEESKILSKSPF